MGLVLVTGPALDPVSVAEAKAHCRVDSTDDDGLIAGYVLAARQHVEQVTGRALITQTYDLTVDNDWPWILDLETNRHRRLVEFPKAPLQSVTSVSYVDSAGVTQTLASNQYVVDAGTYVGRMWPAYGVVWPTVRCQPKTVTIRFVAGYGVSPSSIPEPLRQAILLLVGHWYENREAVNVGNIVTEFPQAVASLLAPFRVFC
jgi:uncharacterized phiE125 gp8 family phage protein